MNVVFTCGGTGGHIVPAIAIANTWKEHYPDSRILFIGGTEKMERELIPKAGYELISLETHGISRGKSPAAMWHNVKTVVSTLKAVAACKKIFREVKPQVIVGTGGYASYPALHMGAKLGIPTAVHESNAVPGLTTRMVAKHVTKIMVSLADSRDQYPDPEQVVVTGTPVRGDFFQLTKEEAKRRLSVDDGRPLLVSFWGSLGASGMNRQMADFLALEAAKEPFHHIHGAGKSGCPVLLDLLREKGVDLKDHPALQVREYIYDMAPVMRAADLVLCRAGASTISELTALGVPALIVPSPYVTNNHQEKNARVLEQHGAAVVLLEPETDGGELYQTAKELLDHPELINQDAYGAWMIQVGDISDKEELLSVSDYEELLSKEA